MSNIREDLIQKEFEKTCTKGLTFRKLKPSNRFIDWLFRHYYVHEHTEHFYDSELDFDDEEFNMYIDYKYNQHRINSRSGIAILRYMDDITEQKDSPHLSKEHTIEELEQAYKRISQQIEDYKSYRIEFNNWIEPYFAGNWGMSQRTVDRISRKHLEITKRCSVSYNGRLFITEREDTIYIYYYGRDYIDVDYWWIFKKKPSNKNIKIK